jgi:hypothetical protein
MKRVTKSRSLLHNAKNSWDGLIEAARHELQRIEERAAQLKTAISTCEKKKAAGELYPGNSDAKKSA